MAKLLNRNFWVFLVTMCFAVACLLFPRSRYGERLHWNDFIFPAIMLTIPFLTLLERRFIGELPQEVRNEFRRRNLRTVLPIIIVLIIGSVLSIALISSRGVHSNHYQNIYHILFGITLVVLLVLLFRSLRFYFTSYRCIAYIPIVCEFIEEYIGD